MGGKAEVVVVGVVVVVEEENGAPSAAGTVVVVAVDMVALLLLFTSETKGGENGEVTEGMHAERGNTLGAAERGRPEENGESICWALCEDVVDG